MVGAGQGDPEAERRAEAIGRMLAERGAIVVCGGLGGVMAAACKGAKDAHGLTIGILPDENRDRANPHLDVSIPTGMGEMRNMLIVRASDCVIAIGGEFGTLSEVAFALKVGKPVVGLSTWELSKDGIVNDAIARVDTAEDAVETALRLASG